MTIQSIKLLGSIMILALFIAGMLAAQRLRTWGFMPLISIVLALVITHMALRLLLKRTGQEKNPPGNPR